MQIIDLFSGIGGFSLAGSWMGWRTIQFCEIDPWCHRVLKKHWPNVPIHTDINTLTPEIIKQSPLYDANEQTIVTGGVPCQPASTAGKRRGESDERWLWPQTIKFIGEFRPTLAVLENVAGLVSMENGKTLDRILADLEDEGYATEQVIIPACAVGAWHRRDRIWIIAHSNSLQRFVLCGQQSELSRQKQYGVSHICHKDVRNSLGIGLQGSVSSGEYGKQNRESKEASKISECIYNNEHGIQSSNSATEPDLGVLADGLPTGLVRWDREPEGVPRVATGVKDRVNRLKGLGNAIVPQIALEVFKAIAEYNKSLP